MQKSVTVKPLSETKEWKALARRIDEALKDPEFVKAVKRFIKVTSGKQVSGFYYASHYYP